MFTFKRRRRDKMKWAQSGFVVIESNRLRLDYVEWLETWTHIERNWAIEKKPFMILIEPTIHLNRWNHFPTIS